MSAPGAQRPRALVLAGICAWLWGGGAADGQVETWRIGTGAADWSSQAEIAAGVLATGILQPIGFTAADNIVAAVDWIDVGTGPRSFVEEGQARVWARVADGQSNLVMVDGDPSTSTGTRFNNSREDQTGRIFIYDLGASFPADRIVLYPNPADSSAFIRAYQIDISDGRSFTSEGRPQYERLRRVESSSQPRIEISFTRQLLRFVRLTTLAANPFDIAEIEVYGEGFVPRARYRSRFVDFSDAVNLGALRLEVEGVSAEGEFQGEASVVLQVRNGADDTPQVFYEVDIETQGETEVSRDAYNSLPERQRTQRYDAQNWSNWSTLLDIDSTGTYEVDLSFLPGPRRFFQFALSFSGTARDVMRVRRLELTHSRPLVRFAEAEVALRDEPFPVNRTVITPTGERAVFTYGARGRFAGGEAGFDGIRIETPSRPEFISLAMGEPAVAVEPDSVHIDASGLRVFFPGRRVTAASATPILVTFATTPLLYNTLFRGWLLDTGGRLPQLLDAGDAFAEIGSNSLQVFGSLSEPLGRFALSSSALTPNGDGANDAVEIFYDLIYLVEGAAVNLEVLDLSGRRVGQLFRGERGAGAFSLVWDGRDAAGERVPPGHYLLRLEVQTQSASFERLRAIAVVY